MTKIVNAFQWKEYIAIEKAKEKKSPKLTDEFRHRVAMVKFVENQKAKNPNFGTMHGMTKKEDMLAPKAFNVYSRAGTK